MKRALKEYVETITRYRTENERLQADVSKRKRQTLEQEDESEKVSSYSISLQYERF